MAELDSLRVTIFSLASSLSEPSLSPSVSALQVGVLAAAGLVALRKSLPRIHDDHEHAKKLARGVAAILGLKVSKPSFPVPQPCNTLVRASDFTPPEQVSADGSHRRLSIGWQVDVNAVETNIVFVDVDERLGNVTAPFIVEELQKRGVLALAIGAHPTSHLSHDPARLHCPSYFL